MLAQIFDKLDASRRQIAALLETVADNQDWRSASGMWSFREVAAHLAVAEKECFLDRVTRIASGSKPQFDYYLNTDRDFSQMDLRHSLRQWAGVRQEILGFVTNLPDEKLLLTGMHETSGSITIPDVLQTMLDHDQEHLQELEQAAAACQIAGRCQTEINELHQFFQDWFNGIIPATDENFVRLSMVLDQNFVIISPGGKLTKRDSLLDGLRNAYNTRSRCKIWIENVQFQRLAGDVVVTTYEEWQQDSAGPPAGRISTALFKKNVHTPNGVSWLHVHETWLTKQK